MPARALHTAVLGPAQHTQYIEIPSLLLRHSTIEPTIV